MKNARIIGLGFLGALACSVVVLAGCATDESATCTDGACADKAATCDGSAGTCKGDQAQGACCKDKAAAKN